MHTALYWSKIVALGIILGIGIQFAHAWTNPTLPAPGGNVAGPLNTGPISQIKSASLALIGNLAANMLQINGVVVENTACTSTGLVARDSGGALLSCQGGVWKKAMGGGGQICAPKDLCGRSAGGSYMGTCPSGGAKDILTADAEGNTFHNYVAGPIGTGHIKWIGGGWFMTDADLWPAPSAYPCGGAVMFF